MNKGKVSIRPSFSIRLSMLDDDMMFGLSTVDKGAIPTSQGEIIHPHPLLMSSRLLP